MSLDFSRNQLDGLLPNWLGDRPLRVLNLRSNKFHGRVRISEGTRPFSSIRILDISNNGFDGSLPDNHITETFGLTRGDGSNAFGYMTPNDSSEYYSVMIIGKGVEIEMVKINVRFATLDLSSNRFCREIARNIGLLKSLKSLNFSHNSFMGTIPPSLGNWTNLESLDLSSNHFVGEIPKELVRLTSLGTVDLSWNNLVGPIPSGGQFNTNPGLCGIPLTRVCGQKLSRWQIKGTMERSSFEDGLCGRSWRWVLGAEWGKGYLWDTWHWKREGHYGSPGWSSDLKAVAEEARRGRPEEEFSDVNGNPTSE